MLSSLRALALGAIGFGASTIVGAQAPTVFQSHCARCHIPVEMKARLGNWLGRSADGLYQRIRGIMPADSPGSLTDAQYLEATAQVLALAEMNVPEGEVTAAALASLTVTPRQKGPAAPEVPWLEYNGNLAAQRYTSLDQIRPDNFAKLKVAWSWSTAPFGPAPEFRNISSPLMVDGTLFVTVGATRDVAAIDARTGQMLWLWRSREGERFEQAPRK